MMLGRSDAVVVVTWSSVGIRRFRPNFHADAAPREGYEHSAGAQ